MIQSFVYSGHSSIAESGGVSSIRMAPNLAREPVAFDAELRDPVRFREAISALHEVVTSDLKFRKRDKTAYLAWKKKQGERENEIERQAYRQATEQVAAAKNIAVPAVLEKTFNTARTHYWGLRQKYADYLRKHDPDLWRKLMPCDPVITVAEDAVLFECFSKDESAYGCLSVGRATGFSANAELQLGTTNVDYSQELYEQFQTLRTYRPTRFNLSPESFTVETKAASTHREEKIDLPVPWLRGFMKLQAAMTMPTTRLQLSRECVYSLLAFLKRNIARKSPRALRFELTPGQPPRLVLEPWEKTFESHAQPYAGPETLPIRIWGIRRLLVLARLLPILDSIEVHLLATGLPSFWVVRAGDMSFTLGLSGWTTNDFSSGSSLDLLQPLRTPSAELVVAVTGAMKSQRAATLADIQARVNVPDEILVSAALRQLAQTGQLIFDIAANKYRYRQIMAEALGEAQLGPEDPELAGARKIIAQKKFELIDSQDGPNKLRILTGEVESTPVEILIDPDDRIKRGKCLCGHFKKYGLRNGPCRHMIALRYCDSVQRSNALATSSANQRNTACGYCGLAHEPDAKYCRVCGRNIG